MAVLPSAERDTDVPCEAGCACPAASVATNFGPCCVNWAKAGWEESRMAQMKRINARAWCISVETVCLMGVASNGNGSTRNAATKLGGAPPPNRQGSGTFAGRLAGQPPALRRTSNWLSMSYN
jgi:hypothetical protein